MGPLNVMLRMIAAAPYVQFIINYRAVLGYYLQQTDDISAVKCCFVSVYMSSVVRRSKFINAVTCGRLKKNLKVKFILRSIVSEAFNPILWPLSADGVL